MTPRNRRRAACCRSEPSPSARSVDCPVETAGGGGEPACRCPTRTSSLRGDGANREATPRRANGDGARRTASPSREAAEPAPGRRARARAGTRASGPAKPAPSRRAPAQSGTFAPLAGRTGAKRFGIGRTAPESREALPALPTKRFEIVRARSTEGTAPRDPPSPSGLGHRASEMSEPVRPKAARVGRGRARWKDGEAVRIRTSPFGR